MGAFWKILVCFFLLASASLLGAILAGARLYPYDRIVDVLQADIPNRMVERSEIETAFHTLASPRLEVAKKIGAYARGEGWAQLTWGGGITAYGNDIVGVTNHGEFFLYQNQTGDPVVSHLDISTNHNREAFVSYVKAQGLNTFDANRWFRHIDLLYVKDANDDSLILSHHYWHTREECYTLRLSKLSLGRNQSLVSVSKNSEDWVTIFDSKPCLKIGSRYEGDKAGGRMVLAPGGEIYLSVGDFGFIGLRGITHAQNRTSDYGKIIRVNPQTGTSKIVSIGHRNPQGLALDADGKLWSTEHGPQGGDELNLIHEGSNYGWPYVVYGTDYGAKAWPLSISQGRHPDYRRPIFAWLPSIAVSNLIFIEGFSPEWNGDILVSSLKAKSLYRMRYEEGRVIFAETIFVGTRVRDLVQLPNGILVLWNDDGTITELHIAESSVIKTTDWMPPDFDEAQRQSASKLVLDCLGCHSIQPGAPESIAPSLWNIYERPIGKSKYFAGYSTALVNRTGIWNEEALDEFLKDGESFAPGNEMDYPPISDEDVRRAVISFLRSLRPDEDQNGLTVWWQSRFTRLVNILKRKFGYY